LSIRTLSIIFTILFFSNDTPITEIYPLSLHDALPILRYAVDHRKKVMIVTQPYLNRTSHPDQQEHLALYLQHRFGSHPLLRFIKDRKSTRLNSSHLGISYAVFCLKKKKTERTRITDNY